MPLALFFTVVLLASAYLSGCIYVTKTTGEQLFTKAQAEKIERGKTTKAEVLQWFGPPVAIVRKNEGGQELKGEEDIRPETFLELFSGKHRISQDHVVYYYRNLGRGGAMIGIVVAGGTQEWKTRERLWILINEKNGIVEDYMLLQDQ